MWTLDFLDYSINITVLTALVPTLVIVIEYQTVFFLPINTNKNTLLMEIKPCSFTACNY
jgi:hypothetical protein